MFTMVKKTIEHSYLGSSVGTQATFVNAVRFGESIFASSTIPPDIDNGPTGSTLHRINSLQYVNPVLLESLSMSIESDALSRPLFKKRAVFGRKFYGLNGET